MLDSISDNQLIRDFLFLYPRNQWGKCVEYTLVIGINAVQSKLTGFVSLEQLSLIAKQSFESEKNKIPEIKAKLSTIKDELEKFNRESEKSKDNSKRSSSENLRQRPSKTLKPPKPIHKKQAPKPLLIESTPRFKAQTTDLSKSKSKDHEKENNLNKENLKKYANKSEINYESAKQKIRIGETYPHSRSKQPSPTLEELLCTSRITQAEHSRIEESNLRKYFKPELSSISIADNKGNFDNLSQYTALDDTFTNIKKPESHNEGANLADFQTPRYPVQVNFSQSDEGDSGILHIADEFLKNPLFLHISKNKTQEKKGRRGNLKGEELRSTGKIKNSTDFIMNGFQSERVSTLNCSPIESFIFDYEDIS
ncbi:unnamed protein product [Blepharisma stoltei]|uniref:Uncharacterized protein n=1 Tax=Blepharisma stoltei TaxID=1481888 RepID=A0AAU9IMR6_9CILI|nr:unnamed protein product [Blepharisma stoltei]